MVTNSIRFYFFTSLIVLNVFTFVGETIFINLNIFLILRLFIIVYSAILFSITMIFIIQSSLANLDKTKKAVRVITILQYLVVAAGTGY